MEENETDSFLNVWGPLLTGGLDVGPKCPVGDQALRVSRCHYSKFH